MIFLPPREAEPMIPYDAHVHSNLAEGQSSIEELARMAEACGLEALVIADAYRAEDHDLSSRVQRIVQLDADSPVRLIPGLDLPIRDSLGTLIVADYEARLAPWVVAGFDGHTRGLAIEPPASLDRLLEHIFTALLAVVTNPLVEALSRPFNLGRFPAPISPAQLPRQALKEVAAAMFENDVAFEITNQMSWWYPELSVEQFNYEYADLLSLFAGHNVKFVVASEARCAGAVGNLGWCTRIMELANIGKSQVVDLPRRFGVPHER
jgi:histidinol phosphatase-like PHP family hydrolase